MTQNYAIKLIDAIKMIRLTQFRYDARIKTRFEIEKVVCEEPKMARPGVLNLLDARSFHVLNSTFLPLPKYC